MAERAFQYLLQPTVRQAAQLERLLDLQRELYNAALEERRGAWAWEGRTVTKYEQFGELTGLAALRPDLMAFGVCAARGTLTRLDRAFYRRCRAGAKPGFPRFKGKGRFESVEYPDQSGWRLDESARRLYVLGVGHIKARLHRPLRGQARTCTIRKEGRRFRVTIFCRDVAERPLAPTGREIGIDLGIAELVSTSDGDHIANPRHFEASRHRPARSAGIRSRHIPPG